MEAEPVFELRFDCRGYCLAAFASPRESLIPEVVCIGVLQADPGAEGHLVKAKHKCGDIWPQGPAGWAGGWRLGMNKHDWREYWELIRTSLIILGFSSIPGPGAEREPGLQ